MNDNKNLLGKVIALALILGAVYGARSIARGGFSCPLGDGSHCIMAIPAATPAPAVDATLEKKAPIVPPAPAKTEKAQ